ncbi:MAG: NlpC/P60 family protein [Planctomycetota bacterium]
MAAVLLLAAAALAGPLVASADAGDRLDADYWIARCPEPDRVLADAAAVQDQNRQMLDAEPSLTDLARLPATLARDDVAARIARRSRLPDKPLAFAAGGEVGEHDRRRWLDLLAVDAVPAAVEPRFALVVRRAAIRGFPTADRVIARGGDADIDQFQETAFFPGTPVAAIHATRDSGWTFVIGPSYDGWVASQALAFGPRDEVLAYAARSSRVVTGAGAATAFTPELPAASKVHLDMGAALPELRTWPAAKPVNGQSPAASVVVELPIREPDGTLRLAPALLPRSADTRAGPLPATRANLLRQAFKFLGERYGWGHDFEARDCSGFVRDVYASLGIAIPRNTRDQAVCPALSTTAVAADWPRNRRLAAVQGLFPGDLVFTRRHVMMVLGHDDVGTWVIHDTHDGRAAGTAVNGVVVQRFLDIDDGAAVDAVTAVVRVLPPPACESP